MNRKYMFLVDYVQKSTQLQEKNRQNYETNPVWYMRVLPLYVSLYDRKTLHDIEHYGKHNAYFQSLGKKDRKKCVRDILLWEYVYGFTPDEYLDDDFPHLSKEERLSHIGILGLSQELVKYTPKDAAERFFDKNKWELYQLFKPIFRRDVVPLLKDGAFDDDFISFTKKHPSFIAKPLDGLGGHGVFKFSVKSGEEQSALHELKKKAPLIIEELLTQSSDLSSLNPSSVNTLRVATFMGGGKYEIGFAHLRIGRANAVMDNPGSGGMTIGVDLNTHKTIAGQLYADYTVWSDSHHPDSGVELGNFEIPDWNGLLQLLQEGVNLMPKGVPYCGWDLAHTNSGWCVVECNDTGEFELSMFTGKGDADYVRSTMKKYALLEEASKR